MPASSATSGRPADSRMGAGRFADALAARRPLLLDGAMGTGLIGLGLPLGAPPERWTREHPDRVIALHRAFLDAGADVLLSNSFGANAVRLRPFGLAGEARALAGEAARLARVAAGRAVIVAGAVGPLGPVPEGGMLEEDAMVSLFAEQMEGLAAGGADLAWIETMSEPAELRAALRAAAGTGLPAVVTASVHRTDAAALTPAAFAAIVAPWSPLAVGVNCGDGPRSVLAAVASLAVAAPGVPLVAKPNAGLPLLQGGKLVYPITPDGMAEAALRAVALGAVLVGGCCGTTPAHLAAMRRALDAAHPRT